MEKNIPVEEVDLNYVQLSRDLERVRDAIDSRLGREDHGRHFIYDVGARRDEARHRDRLALGRAGPVRSARRSAGRSSPLPADGGLREAPDRVGARPPPPVRRGGGTDLRISAVARHQGLGIRRTRVDGGLGPAQKPRWRRLFLVCAPENEAAIYAEALTLNLWPRAGEFGGPVKLIGADPNAKGAPATAQTNYALGTENGYDYDFVPGTGHLLQIEQPAECARLVEEFVAKCGLRRP